MSPETIDPRSEDEREKPRDDDRDDEPADPLSCLIVDHLQRTDGPVEVTRLVGEVAADLTDGAPEEVQRGVRRRVQTWFHHGQLPALDEAGVIEYDPDRGTVRLRTDGGPAHPLGGSRGRT